MLRIMEVYSVAKNKINTETERLEQLILLQAQI
jgi:hypothetical protein